MKDQGEAKQRNEGHDAASFLNSTRPKPESVQLLFADFQPELIANSKTVEPASLASAASVLAKAGQLLGLPMTFCVVPVQGQPGRLLPELLDYSSSANTFARAVTSPFLEPAIAQTLRSNERPTIVVAGFSAEVAVLQSALDALAEGYSVLVPIDAIGSRSSRWPERWTGGFNPRRGCAVFATSVAGGAVAREPANGAPRWESGCRRYRRANPRGRAAA